MNMFFLENLSKMVLATALGALLFACHSGEKALTSNGELVNLLPAKNMHLLLNYWADWCLPCKEEIPELNRLHRSGKESGVAVLGVNYDALIGGDLRDQVAKMGIEFPVLIEDPRLRFGFSEPEVLPMTVLVDSDGKVSKVLVGPQTLEDIHTELEVLKTL